MNIYPQKLEENSFLLNTVAAGVLEANISAIRGKIPALIILELSNGNPATLNGGANYSFGGVTPQTFTEKGTYLIATSPGAGGPSFALLVANTNCSEVYAIKSQQPVIRINTTEPVGPTYPVRVWIYSLSTQKT